MSKPVINRGVYGATEAARLVGVSSERIISWTNRTRSGLEPIVSHEFPRAFTFEELVGLRVAAQLAQSRITEADLRRGVSVLVSHFDVTNPLADWSVLERLATSGASLLADFSRHNDGTEDWVDIGKNKQGVFQEVVKIYLERIQFDGAGKPTAWEPYAHVRLDPRVQAGAPCVAGRRILTATIRELLFEDTEAEIADEYELTTQEVLDAAEFERRLASGVALAA